MGDREDGTRGMTTISTHQKGVRDLSDLPPSLAVRLSRAQAKQRGGPETEDERAEQAPSRRRLRIQRVQRANVPVQPVPSHIPRPVQSQLPDWAPKIAGTGARAGGTPAIPRIQRLRAAAAPPPDLDQEWQLALPPHATTLDRAVTQSAPAVSPEVAALKQELERARSDAEMWRAEAQRTREHLMRRASSAQKVRATAARRRRARSSSTSSPSSTTWSEPCTTCRSL